MMKIHILIICCEVEFPLLIMNSNYVQLFFIFSNNNNSCQAYWVLIRYCSLYIWCACISSFDSNPNTPLRRTYYYSQFTEERTGMQTSLRNSPMTALLGGGRLGSKHSLTDPRVCALIPCQGQIISFALRKKNFNVSITVSQSYYTKGIKENGHKLLTFRNWYS